MTRAASFVGRVLLGIATGALMLGVLLFVIGGSLTAYPVMRLSPRARRMRALVNAGAAVMIVAQAYGLVGDDFSDETNEHPITPNSTQTHPKNR